MESGNYPEQQPPPVEPVPLYQNEQLLGLAEGDIELRNRLNGLRLAAAIAHTDPDNPTFQTLVAAMEGSTRELLGRVGYMWEEQYPPTS